MDRIGRFFLNPFDSWFVLMAMLALAPGALAQGSLCGTVLDENTGLGIPDAGVFLFHQDGDYSGLMGLTDTAGDFCIHDIPPGFYDVQVRVDHYQIGFVTGVEIPDSVSDIEITTAGPPCRLGALWPNPATSRIFFNIHITEGTPVNLRVFDVRGRLVKGWYADSAPGEFTFGWDFRDLAGRVVPVGLYLVRVEAGRWSEERAFVRLR